MKVTGFWSRDFNHHLQHLCVCLHPYPKNKKKKTKDNRKSPLQKGQKPNYPSKEGENDLHHKKRKRTEENQMDLSLNNSNLRVKVENTRKEKEKAKKLKGEGGERRTSY